MSELIDAAKKDLAEGKYSRQKLLDWSALDKGNKSKRRQNEAENLKVKAFLKEHNSRRKPIFDPEKAKMAKNKEKQLGYENPMRSSINEIKKKMSLPKSSKQDTFREVSAPKITKKGTKFHHLDTQEIADDKGKKEREVKDGEIRLIHRGTPKIDGHVRTDRYNHTIQNQKQYSMSLPPKAERPKGVKKESHFRIDLSPRKEDGSIMTSNSLDKKGSLLPPRVSLNKQPSSVSPKRQMSKMVNQIDNELLQHKRTMKIKAQIAEIDFISNLPKVPSFKERQNRMNEIHQSFDSSQPNEAHKQKTMESRRINQRMISRDGSLKSSYDSLDEPTGSVNSKIPLPTSARLKKKGEELKNGMSPQLSFRD